MSLFTEHLLSLLVFLPIAGAGLALAFPRSNDSGVRGFALAVSLVGAALSVWLWLRFEPTRPGMQLAEAVPWIDSFGIRYAVGVDGVALVLVVLTTFLLPAVLLSTYSSVTTRAREYVVCLLLLQAGMLGAFVATDLFLFYVFWELMLIPMYFLIGVWGGKHRIYAALKFFLYTMTGSLLMLVAILYTVWAVRGSAMTFSWGEVAARLATTDLAGAEPWLFLAFVLAFAIKVPMFPLHTWLPDAHVEAPTGGSVILAGVLLKLGTFGFLRYAFWLFPKAAVAFLPALGVLAVIGILYGALVAMVQTDLKRLVAYSSVSHLGFVMLGLTALTILGVSGGVLQMVNHGISTGALFLLVGVIYERRHTRLIADYGGIAKVMPRYAAVFVLIALSSIGLPGLNGFVGELMILLGTFQSVGLSVAAPTADLAWLGMVALQVVVGLAVLFFALALLKNRELGRPTKIAGLGLAVAAALVLAAPPIGGIAGLLVQPLRGPLGDPQSFREVFAVLAVIAATGVIFAAVYLLWAVQRVFFGPLKAENERLRDLTLRESIVLAPFVAGAVLLGVFPHVVLDVVTPSVVAYTRELRQRAALPAEASAQAVAPAAAEDGSRPVVPQERFIPRPPRDEARTPFELRRSRVLPFRERLERLRARDESPSPAQPAEVRP